MLRFMIARKNRKKSVQKLHTECCYSWFFTTYCNVTMSFVCPAWRFYPTLSPTPPPPSLRSHRWIVVVRLPYLLFTLLRRSIQKIFTWTNIHNATSILVRSNRTIYFSWVDYFAHLRFYMRYVTNTKLHWGFFMLVPCYFHRFYNLVPHKTQLN